MNTLLRISGSYNSCKASIKKLINDITNQINKKNFFAHRENIIDMSDLTYIDSNLSVIIFGYIKSIIVASSIFAANIFRILPPKQDVLKQVLCKNNFSKLWNGEELEDVHKTIIKISECKNTTACIENMLGDFYELFSNLKMRENDIFKFVACLGEVFNNCFQHGNAKSVYFSGQFFPQKHELDVTIFNFGKTFRQNISSFIHGEKYISWAFLPETTTDNSFGMGMCKFLQLLKEFNADIIMVSDNEIYTIENGIAKDEIHRDINLGGTLLNIKFKLSEYNIIEKC